MGVELIIRDGSPNWWESPDIWVIPGKDPNGVAGVPVVGQTAYLWANVTNQGEADATQVQVDFWVANPSLQIRKSTANHIGTAYAAIAAGASQQVLCLVPWNVALVNGGHECIVVEASSPVNPLSPPPADPDVLDAVTYSQIAQRNISVVSVQANSRCEIILGVNAGARADKNIVVKMEIGGDLSREMLESLGLHASSSSGERHIEAFLSEYPLCGSPEHDQHKLIQLHVPRRTSAAIYLNIVTQEHLTSDEYALIRVVESDKDYIIGGLSVVVVGAEQKKGGLI